MIRTRRGDVANNVNIESLILFETSEVRRYLLRKAPRPAPRAVADIKVTRDQGQLSHVQWLNDSEIGFLTEGSNQRIQVFIARADSGQLSQITDSSTDIVSFAVAGDRMIYYARAEAPPEAQVIAAGDRSLFQLLFWDHDPDSAPLQLWQTSRSSLAAKKIATPAVRLIPSAQQLWLSPSGDHAISISPSVDAPAHWADYLVPDHALFGYKPDKVRSDPTSWDLIDRTRFQLVDLAANSARPLFDAPTGWLARNCTPQAVFWIDDTRVIVANTFVPLSVGDPEQREERAAGPAIVEYDLRSGDVAPIVFEPACANATESSRAIVSVRWSREDRELVLGLRGSATADAYVSYVKTGAGWQRKATRGRQRKPLFSLAVRESMNQRPRLFAEDSACRCSRLLFDPAPYADHFEFGRAEELAWTDRNGLSWQGSLTFPPDYIPSRKYPLVVQTHGFNRDEFLLDGPSGATTAMAAQSFASAGFLVAQMDDNQQADTLEEAALYAEGYRAAIENLMRMGSVAADRVGMIVFSRTGLPAVRLLADQPDLLAAINIADAGWWGYLQTLLLVNSPQDLAAQALQMTGGTPTVGDLPSWMSRNPLYRIREARAAVRLEGTGEGSVLANWEYYALLKQSGRAVDLVYFPQGRHVLMKPAERLASQGGSVDWFRFWLQDYEDPDPQKSAQYVRWRKLRNLQTR